MRERVEVELYSTAPFAVESTRATFAMLHPVGAHRLVQDGDRFFVETPNPGFIRFAAARQGYVRRVLP